MPIYSYTALNSADKQVSATIEAASRKKALSSLRSVGLTVYEIKPQSAFQRDYDLPVLSKPKSKDMAIFCRQFASIVRAGVPVTDALGMLEQQTDNKRLTAAIREIHAEVEKGESLSTAMGHQKRIFPTMLISMVAAGEESGNLEQVFLQMEIYFEKARKTKSAVTKTMIYPSILIIVMIIVMIVMMTRIVPMFMEVFETTGAELPAITQAVVNFSSWIGHWWWSVLIVFIALVVGCIAFNHTPAGRHVFGFISRKTPVVRKLVVRSACATMCRMLALLMGSGIGLLEAMEMTAINMSNIYFQEAITTARGLVAEGWSLKEGLRRTGMFPSMVCNLVSVGENSGDLQGSLEKLADFYDQEVNDQTQRLLAILEPVIILIMAVFVVILVLAIYLPMLNMTKAYDQYM